MTQSYTITGMTCGNCKATVENYLKAVTGVTHVSISLEQGEAQITSDNSITITDFQNVLPEKYSISKKDLNRSVSPSALNTSLKKEISKLEQLKPLLLIIFYIAVASILLHRKTWSWHNVMLDFMGLFYIVFSFFKMLDLKGFYTSFKMYDPLAKQFPIYGRIYPFIETTLGLLFLMRIEIPFALTATIIILGITTVGVTKTLLDKKSIRCACLGTALKLPMTEATFIENAIMIVMAISMLLKLF